MPRRKQKWKTVSLPEEMVEKIKFILVENSDLGMKSVADFVTDAVRRHPHFLDRLEHYNIYEDHVTIYDLMEKTLVDVYFHVDGIYCEFDESQDCDHTAFVLAIPEVLNILTKKGWIIREGRIISTPY